MKRILAAILLSMVFVSPLVFVSPAFAEKHPGLHHSGHPSKHHHPHHHHHA
jgi:Spy/CpxP family protein refolding chaperone